ncbi:hypothetical protein ALIPUT_00272 [Alistipes putredinis DSM 17216]|uniref:Uncharacterized protein n=1 Tax=Alistipes putredinis DSM 17216 TaxID=445970 RepID=B0MSR9_9BACT|nr:hypothetical protein ALIPUT_00272 [Alistipes putredinis DSM 17216]
MSFSLRFLCPAWPERIPRRPSPVENIELYPLFSTFGLLLRPIENSGLTFFVLFARSDESIRRFPLIENIRKYIL